MGTFLDRRKSGDLFLSQKKEPEQSHRKIVLFLSLSIGYYCQPGKKEVTADTLCHCFMK